MSTIHEKKRNEVLSKKLIKNLESRFFEAYYCPTKEDALKKALEIIPEGSSVSWGGSVTAIDMGLIDAVSKGNYKVIDRDKASSPEERVKLMHDALSADFFIMSSNAITIDGELVNIDGIGNRAGALCYGPSNVVVVVGMNKVSTDVDAAIDRARQHAAPINQARIGGETPCLSTGVCGDCKAPACICSHTVTTRMCRPPKRIKVILIGEDMGF